MTNALPDPFGFGQDLLLGDDVSADMAEVAGIGCLAQDLIHRIETPRGSVFEDPNYGTDLRDYLSKGIDSRELSGLPGVIAAELQKDDRVQRVTVKINSATRDEINFQTIVLTAQGPFKFTTSVTQAQALLVEVG